VHFGPTALARHLVGPGHQRAHQSTVNTVAMWNSLVGGTAPLRLTAGRARPRKFLMILNVSPLNP
jgi:hypothetical protein